MHLSETSLFSIHRLFFARRPNLSARPCSGSGRLLSIVEVELSSHSLEGHVLPQIRGIRYGEPQSDCLTIAGRELCIGRAQAETLLNQVPRHVAVVSNRYDLQWEQSLQAIPVQYLTVSRYATPAGSDAIEVTGTLESLEDSLGFGTYTAVDRSLRFPPTVQVPEGRIQINDPRGAVWIVRRDDSAAWITKEIGTPTIPNGVYVQLIRTRKGTISMRMPSME